MNSIKVVMFLLLSGVSTLFAQSDLPDTTSRAVAFDSTRVEVRVMDKNKLAELKSDPKLNYGTGPAALSFWERFKFWISRFLKEVFDTAIETNWLRVLIYVALGAVLIYVILRLLRLDAIKVFYSGHGKSIRYETLEDNIHEMDFDKLIEEAIHKKDYRQAIRLQFLQALKILSDKDLIHWQPGKTNHDYLDELGKNDLKKGFNDLNFYFEYAWYGNFTIAPELFGKVKTIFNDWKSKV